MPSGVTIVQAQHHLINPANRAYLQNPHLTPKVAMGRNWFSYLLLLLLIVVAAAEGFFVRRFIDHLDALGGGGIKWGFRLFMERPEWRQLLIPGVLAAVLIVLIVATAAMLARNGNKRQLIHQGKVVTGKLIAVDDKSVTYWLRSPMTGLNLQGTRKLNGHTEVPAVDEPVAVLYLDDQTHAVL
ncbi:MAG: hypothetical protein IT320_27345 [Anaerolineae bacterium]|nr:hypothetical protein [Anaerolineae bacterium]